MKPLALLAVTACLALPVAAQAQRPITLHVRTAGDLAALCGANPHEAGADAKINYCHGFAQGVVDVELSQGRRQEAVLLPQPGTEPHRDDGPIRRLDPRAAGACERRCGDGLMHFLGERYPCK